MSRVFRSTYHDTTDRRLARLGVALRRRLENGVSTWELELPEAPGQVAVSASGGPSEPPQLIADLLRTIVRERSLVEVLTVQTRRSESLRDEVSLLEDNTVVDEFVRVGGEDDPGLDVLERPALEQPAKKLSPRERVRTRLREQYEQMLAHDPGTRLGEEPEAVHKFRVAVRRARSLLRSSREMLDRVWADQLRAELGWLGESLGKVRDLDVLLLHLHAQIETLRDDDRDAAVALVSRFEDERAEARRKLEATLSSGRYLNLIARLDEAVEAPRWAGDPTPVEELARREFDSLREAIASLGATPSDERLHRARVQAKRARYAAELAEGRIGRPARRFIRRARQFQDLVGEHQDAVVAERRLRALASTVEPGQGLVAGRLVERQAERRAAARRGFPRAWKKLERAGKKAWH